MILLVVFFFFFLFFWFYYIEHIVLSILILWESIIFSGYYSDEMIIKVVLIGSTACWSAPMIPNYTISWNRTPNDTNSSVKHGLLQKLLKIFEIGESIISNQRILNGKWRFKRNENCVEFGSRSLTCSLPETIALYVDVDSTKAEVLKVFSVFSVFLHFYPFFSIFFHFSPFFSIFSHFSPFSSIFIHFHPFSPLPPRFLGFAHNFLVVLSRINLLFSSCLMFQLLMNVRISQKKHELIRTFDN